MSFKKKNCSKTIYSKFLEGEDERLCDCPLDSFKCNTGGCIPNDYICDGVTHCPDFSDEWDCFNLTAINKTEESETKDTENVLKIKRSDDQYAYVCANNWSNKYSDLVCNKLGYSNAIKWSKVRITEENAKYLEINENSIENDQLLDNFNLTEKCNDEEIVAIECQSYSKLN